MVICHNLRFIYVNNAKFMPSKLLRGQHESLKKSACASDCRFAAKLLSRIPEEWL